MLLFVIVSAICDALHCSILCRAAFRCIVCWPVLCGTALVCLYVLYRALCVCCCLLAMS